MEAVAATAVTATAAAVTFSIGYLVDRRAGPAPIHRGMSRRHHATMAVTAGASTKPTTTKTPAGPSPAFFVSAIRERKMVQAGGLEPPTSGSTDQRSNQLSYACTRDRLRSNSIQAAGN